MLPRKKFKNLPKKSSEKYCSLVDEKSSAQDPFHFNADPDPGSAMEKMDPDPGYFYKIH